MVIIRTDPHHFRDANRYLISGLCASVDELGRGSIISGGSFEHFRLAG